MKFFAFKPKSASITVLCFFFALSCTDTTKKTSSLLSNGEIRGEVVGIDLNESTVVVKAMQLGTDLEENFKNSSKDSLEFVVQPGDLSLLENVKVFRGNLEETFPVVWAKLSCSTKSGLTIDPNESASTM